MKWVAGCISRLSPRAIDRLAWGAAVFFFDGLKLRRRLILRNLEVAYGSKLSGAERERIGRESVYHFGLTLLEFLRSQGHDIAASISINGAEHIKAALEKKQGVYILCCHLGNWEAMGAACTRFIAPSHVLVKRVGSDSTNRFVTELRAKNGFYAVKRRAKGDGYKAIRTILAQREIVGFVMDQARPGNPKLPFFGRPAKTNTSLAAIWRRVPAPIVPAFIIRKGVSSHVIEFLPELNLTLTGEEEKDVLRLSTQFNEVVEAIVRRRPEQYFWMHNRWKE